MGPDTTRSIMSAMIGKAAPESYPTPEDPPKQRKNTGNQRRKRLISATEAQRRSMSRATNRKRDRKRKRRR